MQLTQQGILLSAPALDVVNAFRRRVLADSGTFEGQPCLQQEVNVLGRFYSTFGYILTPNGYKASKLYALRPTNGDGDLVFTRATTATRRTSIGAIAAVSSNVPRLNHKLSQSCAEYLIETGARTNLCLRSEEIDNASWTKTNCTVSADAIAAPDGTSNADSVLETVTSGQHRIEQTFVKAASALHYCFSFYIKANGRDWIYVSLRQGANVVNHFFNINTITRGVVTQAGNYAFNSANIQDVGNGWRRIEIHCTSNNNTAMTALVAAQTGSGVTTDYAGDITKGFYVWGLQLEQANFGTSYIPTTSASVTRNQEVLTNKTSFSSYLGSSEGTIYFRGNVPFDSVDKRIVLTDGTSTKRVCLIFGTNNKARVLIDNTTNQADITAPDVFRSDSEVRIVVTYAANMIRLFMNGVKVGEDTSASIPSGLDRITFNDSGTNFYASFKVLAVANTAISENDAVALSTPVSYPPVLKNIISMTQTGNPDYYAFGNGLSLDAFFPDYSIYIAKRGPSHYLDGGNTFGTIYNAKFNLWSSPFQIIDGGSTYYSGISAGLVGNRIFIQVARYTVTGGVDTFSDIGYLTSVDLTTLTSAEQLKESSSWGTFTALTTPAYARYESYGRVHKSVTTADRYFVPHFEHNGTNHRLKVRIIDEISPGSYSFSDIQVIDTTLDVGEPPLVHGGGQVWYLFARQNAGTEMIRVYKSTDDCATWSSLGDTNLGSSNGDCVVDAVYYNGLINVIYQDRGNGYIMISKNNTTSQVDSLTLNTPIPYDYNGFNDSTDGIGYPSVWEIRPGVFMITFCKETSSSECHVYWTIDTPFAA